MLTQPNNFNSLQSSNETPVGGSMNISFKMSVATSGGPHNGLLVSTGIQTGANNFFCTQNADESIFYNSNAKNMLQMLQNMDNKPTNLKALSATLKPNKLNEENNLKKSIEASPINISSNSLATMLSPKQLSKTENSYSDLNFIDSEYLKSKNNELDISLLDIEHLTTFNTEVSNIGLRPTNKNLHSNNCINPTVKPKPCLRKGGNLDRSQLPPLPNTPKTKFGEFLFFFI